MKFLLVASYADSLVLFRGSLISALIDMGLEVHVVAPNFGESLEARRFLESKGVFIHEIKLRRASQSISEDVRFLYYLWRLVLVLRPDYMLAYTIKPVIYGGIAAWLGGARRYFALITGLGYAFGASSSFQRVFLRKLVSVLYRIALLNSRMVFFQNPDDQALFYELKLLNESASSLVVNGSGVDLDRFSVTELPQNPSFLLIARLLGEKGVREYALAAEQVKERFPFANFCLVGWIDDNPDSIRKEELDEWVRRGTVKFLGKLDDVRPAIAASSVYVLPSYREGTPRTVLEAMAMGRAIITTDAPGCRETVEHGQNGFLVPVQSVEKLSEAMIKLIEHPELIDEMGRRSRQIAESKYCVEKVNAAMLGCMGLI